MSEDAFDRYYLRSLKTLKKLFMVETFALFVYNVWVICGSKKKIVV